MRISDWSSDVCSSDLAELAAMHGLRASFAHGVSHDLRAPLRAIDSFSALLATHLGGGLDDTSRDYIARIRGASRSEEHTSELQSLMRISYAVFCLKKKQKITQNKQCQVQIKQIIE